MPNRLSVSTFASVSNQRPSVDPGYVLVAGAGGGYLSVDAHVGPATEVLVRDHDGPETGPFATVRLVESVQDLTLYFDPEDLPVVEALRKALAKVAKRLKEAQS